MCRSAYAAETLAAEEAFDIGQLCRGFIVNSRDFLGDTLYNFLDILEIGFYVESILHKNCLSSTFYTLGRRERGSMTSIESSMMMMMMMTMIMVMMMIMMMMWWM